MLPESVIAQVLHEANASRVSKDAVIELQQFLEKYIKTIAKKAAVFTKHAKRKTIFSTDVKIALKH